MCSLLAAWNRLREGRAFWWAFSFRGQPGSSECQPRVNKCVIDVGTALVSPPGKQPQSFWFRWAHWGRGLCAPRPGSLPPLITEDNTESRMKRAKETNDIPDGGYASISSLSPGNYVSFLPVGVIALPTRREAGISYRGGGGVWDVSFCFRICMDITTEW